ncbi:hypothetical protein ColTof3_12653 [Colletotrichum tofieldiae]|nr:hypothetical protein ColTof3_12653 [Colletotrichum tofieldiae]
MLPSEAYIFHGMFKATETTRFAKLRSRMDIVAVGKRRTYKRVKDRAKAIISVVGAVDWYNPKRSKDGPDSKPGLGLYSTAFVRELRDKSGDADIFRSRTPNKDVLDFLGDPSIHKYTSLRSMLPFSRSSVLDVHFVLPDLLKSSRLLRGIFH